MPLQSLLNASRILLRGISQVFLQGDPRLGLACLLAIAVGAPPLLAGTPCMHDPRLAFSSGVRRLRYRPYNDHPRPSRR
ncbi:hypothetical protein H7972_25295, partial [Pseudomonas aeruginosa]|nr:hypothetical protein [Pseudomonas aeruginosa]